VQAVVARVWDAEGGGADAHGGKPPFSPSAQCAPAAGFSARQTCGAAVRKACRRQRNRRTRLPPQPPEARGHPLNHPQPPTDQGTARGPPTRPPGEPPKGAPKAAAGGSQRGCGGRPGGRSRPGSPRPRGTPAQIYMYYHIFSVLLCARQPLALVGLV
jgi:hypothetical protein